MPDESADSTQPVKAPDQIVQADFTQAEYKRFYANHVATSMSLFEVRVILNSVQGLDPTTDKLVVDETLNVRMAPELAFALVRSLQKTLTEYITVFGPLRPTKPFPPQTTGTPEAPKTETHPEVPETIGDPPPIE